MIEIFNLLGERLIELFNSEQEAGVYSLKWNAEYLYSGIYFYKLEARSIDGKNNFSSIRKKMILLK